MPSLAGTYSPKSWSRGESNSRVLDSKPLRGTSTGPKNLPKSVKARTGYPVRAFFLHRVTSIATARNLLDSAAALLRHSE